MVFDMYKITLIGCCLFGLVRTTEVSYQVCKDEQPKATIKSVSVTPCDNPKLCELVKGTSPSVSVEFTTHEPVKSVKAKVWGKLPIGVSVPFSLPNPNGCVDSGLTCPLQSETQYSYKQSIPVKTYYPKWRVIVEWKLVDENDNTLLCFKIPVRISASAETPDYVDIADLAPKVVTTTKVTNNASTAGVVTASMFMASFILTALL